MGSAAWLDAALLRVGPFHDLIVAGDGADVELLARVRRTLVPAWTVSAEVPARGANGAFERLVAAAHGKTSGSARAKGYVCLEGACKEPTSDPKTLRALLLAGWAF